MQGSAVAQRRAELLGKADAKIEEGSRRARTEMREEVQQRK